MIIQSIGIVGAGQMGNGIAHVCALAGYDVVMTDISQESLDAAMALIGRNLDRQVSREKVSQADRDAALDRITTTLTLTDLGRCDLPMLLEVRLSPQLNIWVYGYFQHSFEQMIRDGGFRPIVFLYHGLWAAFLAMSGLLAAVTIARSEPTRRAVAWWVCAIYLMGVLVLCKSMASILYGFAFAPAIAFLTTRMQMHLALALVLLVLAYPVLKAGDAVPEDRILELAEGVDAERANSLRFRLDNENVLMDRAMERPFFGWGSWGRNHIYDASGTILTTTDGRWIITMGVYGWVGFLAEFGLLTLPILLLWRRTTGVVSGAIPPWLGGLALIHVINVIDLLPNATITPMTWLIAGALLGYGEEVQLARKPGPAPLRTILGGR